MTRLGVLVNEGKELGSGLETLRGLLANGGHPDPPWREVPKSREAPDAVLDLLGQGIDRLLVWGGDGTVRRCINTLMDAGVDDVDVAILPAGTSNLLAKNLDVPIDLEEAVDIALTGSARPIDLGRMNGEYFAVSGGTGLDALLIREAEDDRKDRWGRLAYLYGAWKHLRLPPAHVEVHVDSRPWYAGPATLVLTANLPTTVGGLEAFRQARPDDGILDIGVVRAGSRLEWLRVVLAVVTGRTESSDLGDLTRGQEVEIVVDRKLPWQVDGGDRSRTDRFTVQCVPAAVRICQPVNSS